MVLEKTLESPLDCKKIEPVSPKGNQSQIFIGRTDAEPEAPKLFALMLRADSFLEAAALITSIILNFSESVVPVAPVLASPGNFLGTQIIVCFPTPVNNFGGGVQKSMV